MKIWLIVIRAEDDQAQADRLTDELCSGSVYKRIERAKSECETILEDDYEAIRDGQETREIEWAEVTKKGGPRRFLGRPKAAVEVTFELHQAEVV